MSTSWLKRLHGPPLAYVRTNGKKPGGVFFPGFMSNMTGLKATMLEQFFGEKDRSYVRFDYTGVGETLDESAKIPISFKQWKDDALSAFEELSSGKQILIGSSMGAWMALMAALRSPERVAALTLIAPAVDFFDEIFDKYTENEKEHILSGETVTITAPVGTYHVNKATFDEAKAEELLRGSDKVLPLRCPVRIIHGILDDVVPYQNSLRLAERLESSDIEIIYKKSGGHRMSEDRDLHILRSVLSDLLAADSGAGGDKE